MFERLIHALSLYIVKVFLLNILSCIESEFYFYIDRDSLASDIERSLIKQNKSPVSTDRGRACADRSSSWAGCGAPYDI